MWSLLGVTDPFRLQMNQAPSSDWVFAQSGLSLWDAFWPRVTQTPYFSQSQVTSSGKSSLSTESKIPPPPPCPAPIIFLQGAGHKGGHVPLSSTCLGSGFPKSPDIPEVSTVLLVPGYMQVYLSACGCLAVFSKYLLNE
jgi:hypothetical protein